MGRRRAGQLFSLRLHGFVDPVPCSDTAHVRPLVFTRLLVEMAAQPQRCCLVFCCVRLCRISNRFTPDGFCHFLFFAADQAVIVELRNQIHLLKNQHDDQLEQLNRERK